VPQHYGLFPHLTILKNIMLGDRLGRSYWAWQRDYQRCRERAENLLQTANLAEQMDKYPSQLSGGQQQRAAVMQALIKNPKVLLMDEPFGALDPGTRERMQIFLLDLWEQTKKTILFVTHDLEEAVFLGPRIVALNNSRIVYDKTVRPQGQAVSTEAKKDVAFTHVIEEVRDIAFGPEHQEHVINFDRQHARIFGIGKK
jgi:NitT/TauT family transport system ATP-binding protein